MIRAYLVQISPVPVYQEVVEMPAVPRVGDSICIDVSTGETFEVRSVIWTPRNTHSDVEVNFR